jgi:hypothetical protein
MSNMTSAFADIDVTAVEVLGHYRLRLTFADGLSGDADVSDLAGMDGDLITPLHDPRYFARVRVDPEQGTVVWPNGADLAAERLYDEVSAHVSGRSRLHGRARRMFARR